MKIDISEINKANLLQELFNNSLVVTNAMHYCNGNNMSFSEAENLLEIAIKNNHGYIDYLRGRPIKCDFSSNNFDTFLYNRDNGGVGSAEKIINKLKSRNITSGTNWKHSEDSLLDTVEIMSRTNFQNLTNSLKTEIAEDFKSGNGGDFSGGGATGTFETSSSDSSSSSSDSSSSSSDSSSSSSD